MKLIFIENKYPKKQPNANQNKVDLILSLYIYNKGTIAPKKDNVTSSHFGNKKKKKK